MEMVYLINGGESGGGGGSGGGATAGYPIVKAVVTDGAVGLQDRSVTRVELKTADPVRINFPPKTEGVARDFLLRLVITSDTVPEVTFAVPTASRCGGSTPSPSRERESIRRSSATSRTAAFPRAATASGSRT